MLLATGFFSLSELNINCSTRKILFLLTSFIIYVLHSGLRHWSVGPDTYQYNNIFENVKVENIDTIWENIITKNGIDPFYDLFQKIFQIFSSDYQLYLIFIASLFFISFCYFLYDNLSTIKQFLLANFIYIAYFSGFYSITGIRQTLATTILLYAYALYKRGKNFFVLALIFFATLFHITSFIFLLIYLVRIKRSSILHLFSIIAFFIILQFRYLLTPIFTILLLSEERFGVYTEKFSEGGSFKLTVLNLAMSVLLLIFHYIYTKTESVVVRNASNAFAISILFLPLQWVNPSAGRIGMYFSIFLLIILPYLVDRLKFKEGSYLGYSSLIVLFILLTFFSSLETRYLFFWQNF